MYAPPLPFLSFQSAVSGFKKNKWAQSLEFEFRFSYYHSTLGRVLLVGRIKSGFLAKPTLNKQGLIFYLLILKRNRIPPQKYLCLIGNELFLKYNISRRGKVLNLTSNFSLFFLWIGGWSNSTAKHISGMGKVRQNTTVAAFSLKKLKNNFNFCFKYVEPDFDERWRIYIYMWVLIYPGSQFFFC